MSKPNPFKGLRRSPAIIRRALLQLNRSAAVAEFISRDIDLWASASDVTLDFSRLGKPTDSGFIWAGKEQRKSGADRGTPG